VKKPAVLLAVALLAAAVGVAQQSSAPQSGTPLGARLKLRWQNDTVTFRDGPSSHELSIRDQFHAVRLEKVVLQSAKESNGFIYLLMDVTGPSKVPADAHQCGAGTESDLIWLKVDKDWKVLDAKNFRYDSCWSTISADDPPKWEGDTLKVTVFSVASGGEGKTLTATYTYKHPEDGFKVSEAVGTK
jgi:hypothetical protein